MHRLPQQTAQSRRSNSSHGLSEEITKYRTFQLGIFKTFHSVRYLTIAIWSISIVMHIVTRLHKKTAMNIGWKNPENLVVNLKTGNFWFIAVASFLQLIFNLLNCLSIEWHSTSSVKRFNASDLLDFKRSFSFTIMKTLLISLVDVIAIKKLPIPNDRIMETIKSMNVNVMYTCIVAAK